MQQLQHGRPNSITQAQLTNWENLINQPSVTMVVEQAPFVCGAFNTYYQYANDIAVATATGGEGCGVNNAMIDFYQDGQLVYRIREACGNPLGALPGIHQENTNHVPTGNIAVYCASDGSGYARIGFSDADGGTTGFITDGAGTRLTANHASGWLWTPIPPSRTATGPWTLKLWVYDVPSNTATYVDGTTGPQCKPTGSLNIGCNYDAAGTGFATMTFNDSTGNVGFVASASGARLTANHKSGFKWTVPASTTTAGNWTLKLYIYMPGVATPVYIDGHTHVACPTGSATPTASCENSTLKTTMGAGSSQTFTVAFDISANPPHPTPPYNPAMTVTITGPGYNKTYANQSYTFVSDGSGGVITSDPITFTPPNVGTYNLTWSLTGFVTQNCGYGSANGGTPNKTDVEYLPFFQVLGGDISAGACIGAGCTESPAIIKGQNTNTDPDLTPDFFGAGSSIGAWATGDITNFVSGMGLGGGAATQTGHGLSFANTANTAPPSYGGNYSADIPSLPDYYAGHSGGALPADLNGINPVSSAQTFNYQANGTGTPVVIGSLGSTTLTAGTTINGYVDGDVIIANNINYGAYTFGNAPRFNLYTRGSIYIAPNVDTLHGVFIAQQDSSGGGGEITTCAVGTVAAQPAATCDNQLTIIGSTYAENKLNLNRTHGNLVNVAGHPDEPAEIFEYDPELWAVPSSLGTMKVNAYTSLPPVL